MPEPKIIQLDFLIQKESSVLSQLMQATDLTELQLTEAARKGAVWFQKLGKKKIQRLRKLNNSIPVGHNDTIFINFNSNVLAEKAPEPSLVSDQVNYSIWYKPKGMLSQGSKWSDHCTITEVVRKRHQKPGHLVHRLDKASSGLMVVAHTKEATRRLSDLFATRKVSKHYRAMVQGKPTQTLPFTLNEALDDKAAITVIESAEYHSATDASTLSLSIETGRKHQIRRHLSDAGLPIIGDRLYGNATPEDPDLQLEAYRLAFTCPFTDKALSVEWTGE